MTIHKAKGLGFDVVIVPGLERATRPDQQPLLRWLEQTRLVGEAEQEEREFVVAPIGRNGKPGGIYAWIGDNKAGGKMTRPSACSMWRPRVPARSCICWEPRR
jgi:hypothetical protein